jgi:hypothetical protein
MLDAPLSKSALKLFADILPTIITLKIFDRRVGLIGDKCVPLEEERKKITLRKKNSHHSSRPPKKSNIHCYNYTTQCNQQNKSSTSLAFSSSSVLHPFFPPFF